MVLRYIIKFLHLIILTPAVIFSLSGQEISKQTRELARFTVPEAKQAVAVDKNYFYVINNSAITKHEKKSGVLTTEWNGAEEGISHLNSGVVIRGRLYCASSNYPASPMASSIEIFDAKTLKHLANHSFGIYAGSATWIDKHDGCWYVGFAHYTGTGSSEGKDTRWTSVIKFNKKWQQIEAWIFPDNIIELFKPKSNSGAAWGYDDRLYCTGHDRPEIYVMETPVTGFTLKHVETLIVPVHGQGIAFDHSVKDKMIIYGIDRNNNQVISFEIK
ncbi:MAG TPA: hypothetical protein PKV22_06660 [Paludibacteraceae bacterium]|nr:hypothetical protein [Paludibacteraceae bacterium]